MWTVVISFLAEVKGISPTRGQEASRLALGVRQARRKAASPAMPPFSASQLLHKEASSKQNWAVVPSVGSLPKAPEKATTVILFWVRVPVLSEQITWVLPSVSTAGIWRTMAFFWAIRFTPMARTMVTTAVSPSGIAATPRLMAIINISRGSTFCSRPMAKISPQMAATPRPNTLPVCFRRFCKGVSGELSWSSSPAILPMAVSMPVAAAIPTPAPAEIPVPAKTVFLLSARGAFFWQTAPASFSTGRDSPVRADSSAVSSTVRRRRRSAGTRSPALRMTTSPGTSCQLSTVCFLPSRSTRALGEDSFFSASMALSARSSWTVPITALHTTIARMMMESTYSRSPRMAETQKEIPAQAKRMRVIKSLNWPKNRTNRFCRRAGRI